MPKARPQPHQLAADARTAIGLFTRIPVRVPANTSAGTVMLWGPFIGLALALALGWGAHLIRSVVQTPYNDVLAVVAVLAVLAWLTRGLHLDGLADTADGLGVRGSRARALSAMKSSDIGAFGVLTMVLVLLLQLAALASLTWLHMLTVSLATALPAGRLAAAWLCRPSLPAAEGSTLGAWVRGSVTVPQLWLLTGATMIPPLALLIPDADLVWRDGWVILAAVMAAVAASWALGSLARARFGGITGDVLGAAVEIGQTVAMVVLLIGISM